MDYHPPGFSVYEILQARILEWVGISSSRGSSEPGIEPVSPMSPALAGRFFTTSATWEAPMNQWKKEWKRKSLSRVRVNQYGYTVISYCPRFTLMFALCVVYVHEFWQMLYACIHHSYLVYNKEYTFYITHFFPENILIICFVIIFVLYTSTCLFKNVKTQFWGKVHWLFQTTRFVSSTHRNCQAPPTLFLPVLRSGNSACSKLEHS